MKTLDSRLSTGKKLLFVQDVTTGKECIHDTRNVSEDFLTASLESAILSKHISNVIIIIFSKVKK